MGVDLDDKKLIVVRDRRKFNQFTIHNVLVDHWVPIVGQIGFLLYVFYTRLSNKENEKAFPGYTLMQKHLKLGRGSISDHNKLLVWCGLIHIEEGSRNKANDYYILAVPEVTPEALAEIKALVLADAERRTADRLAQADKLEAEAAAFAKGGSSQAEQLKRAKRLRAKTQDKFLDTVLKRLDDWRPITDYWQSPAEKVQVVREGQLSLFTSSEAEQGGSADEHSGSEAEHPSSETEHPENDDDDDVTYMILDWMGFDGRLSAKDKNPSVELLLAWALWVQLRGDDANNPVGVARSKWRRGEFPEACLTSYAKGEAEKLVALPIDAVRPFLDEALAGFGRTALEDQIPVEYRDVVKR